MIKHIPHNSSSSTRSSWTIWIVVALAIFALVTALLTRSSSTQNDPGNNAVAVVSVPSHDIAGKELGTNTPTSVPEYIIPTEEPNPEYGGTDYAEAFYATAVTIAQTLSTITPVPGIPPEKQGLGGELMQRAVATTLVLYPVPEGYEPPRATEPPWPPKPVIVNRPAGDGFMIDRIVGDSRSASTIWRVNGWYEETNDTRIVVIAGRSYEKSSPRQGQVYIAIYDLSTRQLLEEPIVYSSPSRHGELRITDVFGERLALEAEDNTQFYFDVPTRTWSSP